MRDSSSSLISASYESGPIANPANPANPQTWITGTVPADVRRAREHEAITAEIARVYGELVREKATP